MISIHDLKDGGIYLMDTPAVSPSVWLGDKFQSGVGTFGYGYALPLKQIGTVENDRRDIDSIYEIVSWVKKARNIK